jgi:hypothetical protein
LRALLKYKFKFLKNAVSAINAGKPYFFGSHFKSQRGNTDRRIQTQ